MSTLEIAERGVGLVLAASWLTFLLHAILWKPRDEQERREYEADVMEDNGGWP